LDKLGYLNLICGTLLLLSFGVGVVDVIDKQIEYGWVYDQTVIINNVETVETINLWVSLISLLMLVGMGLVYFLNFLRLSSPEMLLYDKKELIEESNNA